VEHNLGTLIWEVSKLFMFFMKGEITMKKLLLIVLLIFALSLSACSESNTPNPEFQSTITTIQSETLPKKAALQAEIDTLQTQISDLKIAQAALSEERDTAVEKADKYHSMFIMEEGDDEGDYIFCENAFQISFGYADKVSMRMELIKYLANLRDYNPESMTSEHQTIWSNADDIIVRVHGGGYMFPFLVRFADGGLGHLDAVYDLTYGCYVDFPYLERQFLSIE